MSFDIRVSLKAPNKWIIVDKTFHINKETDARNLADIVMMLLDKNYFDTYDEYVKIVESVGRILQGYEYSVKPYSRLYSRKK